VIESAEQPDPEADEALARVYLQSYQMQRAAIVLDRWMKEAPDDARPYLWRTEVDHRTGVDPLVTIEHYRAALLRDPDLALARLGLAEELRALHRSEEARSEYQTHLVRHPDDSSALLGAGINAIDLNELDEATRLLDQCLTVDPTSATGWRHRARIDVLCGDLAAALGRLNRAVELDPFDLESLHQRSLVLARLDRREEAAADQAAADQIRDDRARLEQLQKQVVRQPDDIESRCAIAKWMFDHGQDEAGLRWTAAILADHPEHAPTHRMLVEFHEKKGEFGLANYHRLHAESEAPSPPR
jgi:tetratricopeptide (TPR) repeat protein